MVRWYALDLSYDNLQIANICPTYLGRFLPLEAPEFGIQRDGVATIFSTYSIAQIVGSLAAAPIMTHFGRRPVLVASVLLTAASNMGFGLGPQLPLSFRLMGMTTARALQGVGSALSTTCLFAMLTDRTSPERRGRVMGIAEFASASGWTVGPPVGGILFVAGGWLMPFEVLTILSVVFLLALVLLVPPMNVPPNASTPAPSPTGQQLEKAKTKTCWRTFQLVSSWDLFLCASCAGMILSCWSQWDLGFSPWIRTEFGLSTAQIGEGVR